MKPLGALEIAIYEAAYAIRLDSLISAGYPNSWRIADSEDGRPAGDGTRLAAWEAWATNIARESAENAVLMHRKESE